MGWTGIHAKHYNGFRVDRKAELDEIFTQSESDGFPEIKVLKSSMIGAVYYAAMEVSRGGIVERVFGEVCLTSTNMRDYWNFYYKELGECEGYNDCPKSIIKLLTPTEFESCNRWRQENLNRKSKANSAAKLPVGTLLKVHINGQELIVEKMAPNHQFKRNWYYRADTNTYVPAKHIKEFEVIKEV